MESESWTLRNEYAKIIEQRYLRTSTLNKHYDYHRLKMSTDKFIEQLERKVSN